MGREHLFMTGKSGHWIGIGGPNRHERPLHLAQPTPASTAAIQTERLLDDGQRAADSRW